MRLVVGASILYRLLRPVNLKSHIYEISLRKGEIMRSTKTSPRHA